MLRKGRSHSLRGRGKWPPRIIERADSALRQCHRDGALCHTTQSPRSWHRAGFSNEKKNTPLPGLNLSCPDPTECQSGTPNFLLTSRERCSQVKVYTGGFAVRSVRTSEKGSASRSSVDSAVRLAHFPHLTMHTWPTTTDHGVTLCKGGQPAPPSPSRL